MNPTEQDLTLRFALLDSVYRLHENWFANHAFACRSGCATCCTQSVTMTALEGLQVVEHCHKSGHQIENLVQGRAQGNRQTISTNAYARLCLSDMEPQDQEEAWDLRSCPFLETNRCTIYPVRPFMCRAFVSFKNCGDAGTAELPSHLVTANTVFMQIIEHIAQGMAWGNMLDVLRFLTQKQEDNKISDKEGLCLSEAIPGFLVSPEESSALEGLFAALQAQQAEGRSLAAWLQEGMAG